MPTPLRVAMLGTKDFALPTFENLCATGHEVVALITQPDRPQGRRQEVITSAIKQAALDRGVRVEQPESLNAADGIELVRALGVDMLVTAAYGQILSAALLAVPRFGGINLHGSILPRYRGAAPVARAIERGEAETGVTVIRMAPQVDAGGMLAFATTPIGPDETAGEVEARLARIGAPLIPDAIAAIADGRAVFLPQDPARATRAPKLTKDDGRIDWTRPAGDVHNLVRAMKPWPVASTLWSRDGPGTPARLIVHRSAVVAGSGTPGRVLDATDGLVVAAGSGAVRLLTVQPEGKRPMDGAEFARGYRVDGARMHS